MIRRPFEKAERKDPLAIYAGEYNAFLDALGTRDASALRNIASASAPQQIALIRNMSDELMPAYGACAIEEVGIEPRSLDASGIATEQSRNSFKRNFSFVAKVPEAKHKGRIAIPIEGIHPGRTGRAVISGVVACKVLVENPASKTADLLVGDVTKLRTDATGVARILWLQDKTGTQWALVHLGAPRGSQSVAILAEPVSTVLVGEIGQFAVLTGPLNDPQRLVPNTFVNAVVWEHPVFPKTRCLLEYIDLSADVSEFVIATTLPEILLQDNTEELTQDNQPLNSQAQEGGSDLATLHVSWSEYGDIIWGVANEEIPANGSGEIRRLFAGVEYSPLDLLDVYLPYLHQGQNISAGRQVTAKWEGGIGARRYVVIEAECEDGPSGGFPSPEVSLSGNFDSLDVSAQWIVNASSAPHSNAPGGATTGTWWLTVLSDADTALLVRQNAAGQHDGSVWQRFSNDGGQTWTSWTQIS